jgi:hypothetical protein
MASNDKSFMAGDVSALSWLMGTQETRNQMLKANDGISGAGELQHGAIHPGRKSEERKLADLDAELKLVTVAWTKYQANRDRNAVYGYLEAVFAVVAKWTRSGCAKSRTVQALASRGLEGSKKVEPYAAVIACTATVVDRKTKSKWSRALRQTARLKDKAESLAAFIKRQGGINACAANFSELGARKGKVKVARQIWE